VIKPPLEEVGEGEEVAGKTSWSRQLCDRVEEALALQSACSSGDTSHRPLSH
jgi:hypothetical protein